MTIHLLDHRAEPGAIARNTIRSRAERLLTLLGLADRELSLVLCDDEEIQELNKSWRKKDKATDVLSFPQDDEQVLGDVVLSIETAIRQSTDADGWARAHALGDAPGRTWGPLDETTLLLIHGVLHLLGHDHHKKAEAQTMRAEEARLFSLLTQRAPRVQVVETGGEKKTRTKAKRRAESLKEGSAPIKKGEGPNANEATKKKAGPKTSQHTTPNQSVRKKRA
jgi:probable rRNA maturation factor